MPYIHIHTYIVSYTLKTASSWKLPSSGKALLKLYVKPNGQINEHIGIIFQEAPPPPTISTCDSHGAIS